MNHDHDTNGAAQHHRAGICGAWSYLSPRPTRPASPSPSSRNPSTLGMMTPVEFEQAHYATLNREPQPV